MLSELARFIVVSGFVSYNCFGFAVVVVCLFVCLFFFFFNLLFLILFLFLKKVRESKKS